MTRQQLPPQIKKIDVRDAVKGAGVRHISSCTPRGTPAPR